MANVVIVVDMLRGFHDMGNLANPRVAGIIPNVRKLLERKTEEGWKIIFLRDFHKPDDKEFEMFPPHCVAGTKEAEIIDGLSAGGRKAVIINKTRYSGFFGTKLENVLRKENPEEVIVAGVCTDICVLHTVADLANRDYGITVIKDCVETFDLAPDHLAEEVNQWALNHMRFILGAKVKKLQEVL